MIAIDGLVKTYGSHRALDGLTMHVAPGRIYGLIGPNGSGKTTCMLILSTLLRPDGGAARVGGYDVVKRPLEVRRLIGYMPDFFGVYDGLKADEYLEFFAAAHGVPAGQRPEVARKLLELVNLEGKAGSYVDNLSRGMKQRLALARCLVHDPQVLILDEPASGLDPRARAEVKEIIRHLGKLNKTVLISSHILPELAEICDDVGILEEGRLVAAGPVAEITGARTGPRELYINIGSGAGEAEEIIQSYAGVLSLTRQGAELKVLFSGEREAQAGLLASLINKGIPVLEFYEHRGNLEDAFMAVTGEVRHDG